MILDFLRRVWSALLRIFVPTTTTEERFLKVLEQITATQAAQAKFMQDWMDALRAQSQYPVNKPDRDLVLEGLTYEAQMGNHAAREILASEENLNTYLKSIHAD